MRSLFVLLFCLIALDARSQTGAGSQDSSFAATLRPRYGEYLIQTFPSPAKAYETITVQFYNHNDAILTCKVFDMADREMLVLLPKQLTPGGLHTFQIAANSLSTGTYFIRLTTYSGSDAETSVDNTRFVIVH